MFEVSRRGNFSTRQGLTRTKNILWGFNFDFMPFKAQAGETDLKRVDKVIFPRCKTYFNHFQTHVNDCRLKQESHK